MGDGEKDGGRCVSLAISLAATDEVGKFDKDRRSLSEWSSLSLDRLSHHCREGKLLARSASVCNHCLTGVLPGFADAVQCVTFL